MATADPLFQLVRLISATDIQLSARSECGRRQLLAFVTGSGHLTLYYLQCPGQLPVLKIVPWFLETTKRIAALTFDPSGAWLLVAGHDGTLYIVPALSLVDPEAVSDHRWSTTDVTTFVTNLCSPTSTTPTSISSADRRSVNLSYQQNIRISRPTCLAWWQCVTDCQHVAVVGTDRGDILFVSLTAGAQVGLTYIKSCVASIQLCQDNSLDNVFLLITNEQRNQWKLLLEQRTTGYIWPLDNVQSKNSELTGSHGSLDLDYSSRTTGAALPTARSRLQGLKQLSVEKLASLKQRLADTRSKGVKERDNTRGRRGSSGSSSDETQGRTRKTSFSSDGPDWSSSGPIPDRLSPLVGETFLQPQYARGRYLLSGFYAPNNILTIHGMSLEVIPLFVYRLAPQTADVLVTDRFLFVADESRTRLSVVSCPFAEGRLDGDSDYNPDAIIEAFPFVDAERVLAVYKRTDPASSSRRSKSSDRSASAKRSARFALPRDAKELDVEERPLDTCVVVTTAGVYEVALRWAQGDTNIRRLRPPVELFMDLVLKHQELEEAERLAQLFGLDLQRLLELAGDLMLAGKHFPQSIALYKLSRCRHLKSVLKFAAAGYSKELLGYVTMLFNTAAGELSPSERIHLANLAVMAFTDQLLKAVKNAKKALSKQFLTFLRRNPNYDEVLAVNVAGQTGLWEILQFLASQRGLHLEVLDILTKILRSLLDGMKDKDVLADKTASPALDPGLWVCVSAPGLLQSLLARPQLAKTHLAFVSRCLPHLEPAVLERLATLFDPSSAVARPAVRRILGAAGRRRRRQYSVVSTDSDSCDYSENVGTEDFPGNPVEEMLQLFVFVLLHLARKRTPTRVFDRSLMDKIQVGGNEGQEPELPLCFVPLQTSLIGAGFCHTALVRNGTVFTWGNAVQGCLGTGPTMSRYSCPQNVSMFHNLKVEVFSVACGRQHTLALTSNGVYAWGSSQFGQLGVGPIGQSSWPMLIQTLAREKVMAISAGQYHSLALTCDGRVYSWGWGVHGQLGHRSIEDCNTPKLIEALTTCGVKQISAGHGHSLVLTADGEVFSFGSSIFGQLGRGTNTKSSVPVRVEGIGEPVVNIATNYFHNLAVTSTNRLYIWGASPQVLRLQAQAQKKARLMQQHCAQTPTFESSQPIAAEGVASPLDGQDPASVKSPEEVSMNCCPKSPDETSAEDNRDNSTSNVGTENQNVQIIRSDLCVDLDSPVLDLGPNDIAELFNTDDDDSKMDVDNGIETQNPHVTRTDNSASKIGVESLENPINDNQNTTELDEINQNVGINVATSEQNARNEDTAASKTLTKKSFTQSVADYFTEHKTALTDSSLNTQTNNAAKKKSNDGTCTEVSNSSRKRFSEKEKSPDNRNVLREMIGSASWANGARLKDDSVKCDSFPKPDGRDSNNTLKTPSYNGASDECTIPSIVISPTSPAAVRTADVEPVKKPAHTISRTLKKPPAFLLDDGVQTHLSPQLVNLSLVVGQITQVACGCHHSALVTKEGVLHLWGRNLDGQLGTGSRKEVVIPTPVFTVTHGNGGGYSRGGGIANVIPPPFELRRVHEVACGCEYTVALDWQSSKLWAWGSNSLAQLGKVPIDDTKAVDGKMVVIKTVKRVIKLPHGSQNSCETPREVPNLPGSNITFRQTPRDTSGGFPERLPALSALETPRYGPVTLHYALQRFHDHYDSAAMIDKCVELEDFQAAAKVALLDRNYHLALTHQLKALVLSAKHGPKGDRSSDVSVSEGENKVAEIEEGDCDNNKPKNPTVSKVDDTVQSAIDGVVNADDKIDVGSASVVDGDVRNKVQSANGDVVSVDEDRNAGLASVVNGDVRNEVPSANDGVVSVDDKIDIDSASVVKGDIVKNEGQSNNATADDKTDLNSASVVKGDIRNEVRSANDSVESADNDTNAGLPSVVKDDVVNEGQSANSASAEDDANVDSVPDVDKNGAEGANEGDSKTASEVSSPSSVVSTPSPSEIHAFAVQGGNEEMSEGRRELSSPSEATSPMSGEATNLEPDGEELPPTPSDLSDEAATAKTGGETTAATRPNELKLNNALTSVMAAANVQMETSSTSADTSVTPTAPRPQAPVASPPPRDGLDLDREVVSIAAEIVEHYISQMEDDSHSMMSRMLQHGLDFWLSHSLPVEQLESLLLKHMTKFFYPLGLLLFNQTSSKEGEEPDTMLNRLSTRFCLQLCSTLLTHINQRKPHPEYVELLANVTSLQLSPSPGINGSSFGHQSSSQPEQLMETILARLGGVTTLPYVNIQEQAIASCLTERNGPGRLYAFSCGHHYSSAEIHQSALPEVERNLPNTGRVLKTLFEESPQGGRLACPKCVLAHVASLPAPP